MKFSSDVAQEISDYFRNCYEQGLITTRDGNVCVKMEGTGYYLVTASGTVKSNLRTDTDFVFVNEDGKPTRPQRTKPSIETLGHLAALEATGKTHSVHVHSPCSVAFYSTRNPSIFDWPELTRYTKVGSTIPYLNPGSKELHEAIKSVFTEELCDIVVFSNHGVLAVGNSLQECHEHIERLEHTANIWIKMLTIGAHI